DKLVVEYKKENPNDQSIWNSDISRSAYIIRECINKESEWSTDKGGHKTSTYVIKPILDYLKTHIKEYITEVNKELQNGDSTLLNDMLTAQCIINDIDN